MGYLGRLQWVGLELLAVGGMGGYLRYREGSRGRYCRYLTVALVGLQCVPPLVLGR